MSISELRLALIDKIMHMEESSLLSIEKVINDDSTDWWDMMSKEEQEEIEEGLAQADRGEHIPHSEVMKRFDKWK
ncbi:MAG: hypothetical protein R2730_13400 [Chitinophagales bacterium]